MTSVEFSTEVDAPAEVAWEIASDPRNLPQWDKHIVRVDPPSGGMQVGARYTVILGLMGVHARVRATVQEWEPPWRSCVKLEGLLEATVTTSVASLPYDRSMLRHEVAYRFRGPLGGLGAAALNAMGGAHYALRRGVWAQKREIEERSRA
jgi:uncharacterized membrane protein